MASSYSDSINEKRQSNEQYRVAEIILERLDRIVRSGDEQARRRWFWELLQNACDVTPPSRKARVEVRLNQQSDPATLAFRHNGGAFTSDDLVRLTQQSSNKRKWSNREEEAVEERPESIGRFGTGFLTTHLLSRKAKVKGILHDEGEEPRRFTIPLDRSGQNPSELQEGVQRTFDALQEVDDSPLAEGYQEDRLNTDFLYRLDNRGVEVAQEGIEEANRLLPYVMAFNQRIDQANLVYRGVIHLFQGKDVILEEGKRTLEIVCLAQHTSKTQNLRKFAVMRGEKAELALPVREEGDEITVSSLGGGTPRLFCGFPLVGTSQFPLPVVVNSTHFHPTEKRDGVRLTQSDKERPTENRRILEEVAELYQRLITIAANQEWNDLFHLADVGMPDERNSYLSKSWYTEQILEPIHTTLSHRAIVETVNGERKLLSMGVDNPANIPVDSSAEAREAYWELRSSQQPDELPVKDHIHEWYRLTDKLQFDLFRAGSLTVCSFVDKKGNLEELSESLGASEEKSIEWLEELYDYLIEHGEEKYFDVYTDKRKSGNEESYPILLNQNGQFDVKSNIYFDDEIPEPLKDIALQLGKDFRDVLLHEDLAPDLALGTLTDCDAAAEITSRIEDRLGQASRSEETKRVFGNLLSWFDENPVYAEELFGSLYENKHRLRTDAEARRDRQKAKEFDRLRDQVKEHGFSSTKEVLQHLEEQNAEKAPDGDHEDKDEGASEARKEIISIITDRGIKTPEDLDEAQRRDPELFSHVSSRSLEKLRQFLSMLGRVKGAVRGHFEKKSEYDASTWTDHEVYPTVVSVKKRGRDIYIVLRPADQNKVIFYESMELDTLELSDAELWVQAPNKQPMRLTSGHVLRAIGVQPQTGIRLPADIFSDTGLNGLTRGHRDQKD